MQLQLQKRTEYGSQGRPVSMAVNCFKVTRMPDGIVHHFDVHFSVNAQDKRQIIKWLLQHPQQRVLGDAGLHATYDGMANIYLFGPPFDWSERTFTINEGQARGRPAPAGGAAPTPRGKPLMVKLTLVGQFNVAELVAHVQQKTGGSANINEAITALNLAMKHAPSSKYPSKVAKFYIPPANPQERVILSGGLEVWRGYFTSVRPAIGQTIFNFDTCAGCFRQSGDLIEVLMQLNRARDINDINTLDPKMPDRKRLRIRRFLLNLTITIKEPSVFGKFKIKKISKESAANFVFEVEEGKTMSVQRYIEQKYGTRLRYPFLPLVQVTKTAYYPLELCDVVRGGTFYGKLDFEQVSELLKTKFTTMRPIDKMAALRAGMQYLELQNNTFKHWNFDIDKNPMTVKARVLEPPRLSYKDGQREESVMPRDGVWDVRGKKATLSGRRVDRVAIVVFSDDGQGRESFPLKEVQIAYTNFVQACRDFGINITQPQPPIHYAGPDPLVDVKKAMIDAFKKGNYSPQAGPQLIVTFTTKSSSKVYGGIKALGDCQWGIATQNMLISKARGAKPQYFQNVALKVNVKLAGINQTIQNGPPMFKQKPTIVFGADVTHPGPGSLLPSIVAVVSSHDLPATAWTTHTRVQASGKGQEMISDLQEIARSAFTKFFQKTKRKPERVLFFRDGVAEGQFDEVMRVEVAAIKKACASLSGFNPTITFIVCGKRHNVRFFPSDNDADRSGNAKAGTIIDRDIVQPYGNDFYLMSHAGLIGTSRPCHYSVLVDEAKMGQDLLQATCYHFAYLYPRCARSVSIAAPAYFAHHVATRARNHIGASDDDASTLGSKSDSKSDIDRLKAQKLAESRDRLRQMPIHANISDTMYFM